MLGQGQYDEFGKQLDLLIESLVAAAPQVVFRKYNVHGQGRPGIFAFGARTSTARYQFQLSILIRWSNSAILDFLEATEPERETTNRRFAAKAKEILSEIETRYRVDWGGGSQDSSQALTIELEEV
jgi:hypothetical protein